MYLRLSDCNLNDKLLAETRKCRVIEAIVDFCIDEFRQATGLGEIDLSRLYVNLLDDGDTVEVELSSARRNDKGQYTESIEDWDRMLTNDLGLGWK